MPRDLSLKRKTSTCAESQVPPFRTPRQSCYEHCAPTSPVIVVWCLPLVLHADVSIREAGFCRRDRGLSQSRKHLCSTRSVDRKEQRLATASGGLFRTRRF